ncbi:HAD family phosphatase [Chitinophaga sp. XS-30]|uniref:HAD family hydrolase n=1 Tax=Chitinophaga sp. XS-30 TaxID=2604421 RepID=UPI0011DD9944|nr:HAD family phosphatase [Chitinophaga sp. XS-30]QEH40006.1 HAD family phosphatase [Chitinophaga sp. XS-30]
MQGIKHIIFDLGGVILNIDYKRTEQAFTALGVKDFSSLYSQFNATPLFEDLETGRVENDAFVTAMLPYLPEGTTPEAITGAWNAMLLDFPLARLQLLQQLRQHYSLYLLSNTNAIHLAAFNAILEKSRGIPSLDEFFDKSYYSHQIGYRKPEKEAYQVILDENNLQPAETLFIDDTLPNVEAARELGIRAIHLQAPRTILDVFRPV